MEATAESLQYRIGSILRVIPASARIVLLLVATGTGLRTEGSAAYHFSSQPKLFKPGSSSKIL